MDTIQAGDTVKHRPTDEVWYVLGVNARKGTLCVAGWLATIGELRDCELVKKADRPLTDDELQHRREAFGGGWD